MAGAALWESVGINVIWHTQQQALRTTTNYLHHRMQHHLCIGTGSAEALWTFCTLQGRF